MNGYKVKYHEGEYELDSEIIVCKCDACEIGWQRIQVLPAEHNAGEIFTAKLCRACLLRLADKLIKPEEPKS